MTGLGDIMAIFGIAFCAAVLIFLMGIGSATLSDWIIEHRLRAWRRYIEQNTENNEQ